MLLADVDVEAVGHLVQVVLADAADEAVVLQFVLNALHLVSQGAKGVNNETCKETGKSFLVLTIRTSSIPV